MSTEHIISDFMAIMTRCMLESMIAIMAESWIIMAEVMRSEVVIMVKTVTLRDIIISSMMRMVIAIHMLPSKSRVVSYVIS